MILGVSGADHRDAGDELGITDLVPLLGQVEDHTELAVFHLGSGDIGLGQHGDGVFLGGGHLSGDLRGLAVVFDLHVLIGIQAVLLSRTYSAWVPVERMVRLVLWTVSPFSTTYSTPSVLTASTWMPPLVFW